MSLDTNTLVTSPAPAGAPTTQAGMGSTGLLFIIFITLAYIVLWRPQQQRNRAQQKLLQQLTKGDEIVTTAGLVGTITKLADRYLIITSADKHALIIQKSAVLAILPKGSIAAITT